MSDKQNVSASKPMVGGAISIAKLGTPLPTDAKMELDAAFKNLGYISEDGITNSNSAETSEIKAWGGDVVLTTLTSKPDTFKYTLIESLDINVLKYVYGDDNVKGDLSSGITISATSKENGACAVVIDMVLNEGALKRIVIPNCSITSVGDITYKDDSAIGYELTVTAYPDSESSTHKEYILKA